MFGGHRLGAFEHFARSSVALANFALLVVAKRQNPQRQNFVDLRPIEEVTIALRRDLRIVVQNDRRREHGVPGIFISDHYWPRSHIPAFAGGSLQLGWRINLRNKLAAIDAKDRMR